MFAKVVVSVDVYLTLCKIVNANHYKKCALLVAVRRLSGGTHDIAL